MVNIDEQSSWESIMKQIATVQHDCNREERLMEHKCHSDRSKSKRLLMLFQKDLLPGVTGKILENKDYRDSDLAGAVSMEIKILCWVFVLAIDIAMLYFVFLFALGQDSYRQRAWAKSFAIWLSLDIIVVSFCIVTVMHVMIPWIAMADIHKVRQKLLDSINNFNLMVQDKQQQQQHLEYVDKSFVDEYNDNNDSDSSDSENDNTVDRKKAMQFNAAEHFFVSNRLAQKFPSLQVSELILQFSTPWPRQALQYSADVSKDYDGRFSGLFRSAWMVAVFFLSMLLSMPLPFQDIFVSITSSTAMGYIAMLFIKMYKSYPVLFLVLLLSVVLLVLFGVVLTIVIVMRSRVKRRQIADLSTKPTVLKSLSCASSLVVDPIFPDYHHQQQQQANEYCNMDEFVLPLPSQVHHRTVQHVNRRASIQQGIATLAAAKQLVRVSNNDDHKRINDDQLEISKENSDDVDDSDFSSISLSADSSEVEDDQ